MNGKIALSSIGMISAAAATIIVGGSGVSNAAPAPRAFDLFGTDVWSVGDHAGCGGTLHIDTDVDSRRPGHTIVSLTSRGFRGNGPDWTRNPVCRMNAKIMWMDGVAPFSHQRIVPLSLGEAPQAPVRVDLPTGSGLNYFLVGTDHNPQKPISYYMIVP